MRQVIVHKVPLQVQSCGMSRVCFFHFPSIPHIRDYPREVPFPQPTTVKIRSDPKLSLPGSTLDRRSLLQIPANFGQRHAQLGGGRGPLLVCEVGRL
jgi:hypothetical protein